MPSILRVVTAGGPRLRRDDAFLSLALPARQEAASGPTFCKGMRAFGPVHAFPPRRLSPAIDSRSQAPDCTS
ncbi:hypothetical protein CHELA40_11126 [Chelatococcus asaccharovorans]|nr:hypothetical protein CHELA40_11126 [Chelatococcus asaccharovorans]CAH1685371.1 hypothetical protein CHELA17_64473 [Chelatococcus asaccharovorans]